MILTIVRYILRHILRALQRPGEKENRNVGDNSEVDNRNTQKSTTFCHLRSNHITKKLQLPPIR